MAMSVGKISSIFFSLQDESRLKTVTMNASTIDFKEQSQRLIEEIKKLQM